MRGFLLARLGMYGLPLIGFEKARNFHYKQPILPFHLLGPTMNKTNRPICPQCGEIDCVQKVSAIVKQETVRGKTSTLGAMVGMIGDTLALGDVNTTSKHHSQSGLAEKLRRPKQPETSPLFSRFYLLAGFGAFLLLCFIVGLKSLIEESGTGQMFLIACGCLFVPALLCWIVAYRMRRKWPEAKQLDEEKLREWQEQIEVWNDSYYCRRCDGTFELGKRRLREPGEW
jgi:hypothetical protein